MSRRKLLRSQLRTSNLEKHFNSITYNSAIGMDNMTYKRFKEDKEIILSSIKADVLSSSYNFVRYKEKLILKNRNSYPRCISIPTLKDKLCLKVVLETLKEYFPECSRTLLPQECIKQISENMINNQYDYFIKFDIQDFFGSIDHELLLKLLRKRIKDKELTLLIKKAIKNPTFPLEAENSIGLPQGLSISNILSHIYLSEFDNFFRQKDYFICRYVDDIIILCNLNEYQEIKADIEEYLENKMKLQINRAKYSNGFLNFNSFSFLGYTMKKDGNNPLISVNKNNVYKLESKIINLITKFKYQQPINFKQLEFELNLLIAGSSSYSLAENNEKEQYFGWIFFYSQINDKTILFKLDSFIKKILKSFFSNDILGKINIKSFVKAYFENRYNRYNSNYFFRPDNLNFDDKKQIIEQMYGYKTNNTDEVENMFRKIVYKQIKNNEKDLIHSIS